MKGGIDSVVFTVIHLFLLHGKCHVTFPPLDASDYICCCTTQLLENKLLCILYDVGKRGKEYGDRATSGGKSKVQNLIASAFIFWLLPLFSSLLGMMHGEMGALNPRGERRQEASIARRGFLFTPSKSRT